MSYVKLACLSLGLGLAGACSVSALEPLEVCPDYGALTLEEPRYLSVSGRLIRTCYGMDGDVDSVSATNIIVTQDAVAFETDDVWPLYILSGLRDSLTPIEKMRLVTRSVATVWIEGIAYDVREWADGTPPGIVLYLLASDGDLPAHLVTLSFREPVAATSPDWTLVENAIVAIFDEEHQLTRLRYDLDDTAGLDASEIPAMVRDLTRVLAWADGIEGQ